ncbi:MAG: hypothetical protein LW834_07065 [Cyanobium sp. 49614_E6]|nr:hypothetical protein [Cyanobium sp. 49614_E6]
MTSNQIVASANTFAAPQRSQSRSSQLINAAISDGMLSSKDIDELYEGKQIPLSNIFGIAAQNRASLEGQVRSQHHVNVNENGSWSWTPNQASYAPLYHPDGGDGSYDGGNPISPGQGTGWVRTGETKGKYDQEAQATYTYYGDPSYLNQQKEEGEAASGTDKPATPGVAPANTQGELKKSFNLSDYMTAANGGTGTATEAEGFKANTTPTLYDDWVKRQPTGSPLDRSSSSTPSAASQATPSGDATSTRRWDRGRTGDGSYRFAASQKFRNDLNSRLGAS